jgi:chorismate--pyruvate lyase
MRWTVRNSYRGPVRRWTGAVGSLSARLTGGGRALRVQVLSQGRRSLRADEARALCLPASRPGYVREVLLRVDGQAVVFARSVTAHAQSLGPWRALRGLGSRPLADLLFKRSAGMARTPLEFARLAPASPVHRHVARAWQRASAGPAAPGAWPARRSVFRRGAAPLLVMEVFAARQTPWSWPCASGKARAPELTRK